MTESQAWIKNWNDQDVAHEGHYWGLEEKHAHLNQLKKEAAAIEAKTKADLHKVHEIEKKVAKLVEEEKKIVEEKPVSDLVGENDW